MATRLLSDSVFRRYYTGIDASERIVPHLERALVKRGRQAWPERYVITVRNDERVFDGYFHPSSDAAAEPLFLYYKFHPRHRLIDIENTLHDVMAMHIGSALHAVVQSLLIELGIVDENECEVTFKDEYRNCSGTMDVRYVRTIAGSPTLEIKTCSYLPKAPNPVHVAQLQPYLDLGAPEADYGLLLYVEKAYPHRFREFIVRRDPDAVAAIYRKWSLVLEAIEFDDPSILPVCSGCSFGNEVFRQCPAQRVCSRVSSDGKD